MVNSDYLRRPDVQGHLKVMEVLREWDPIGVICESNQDEYDMYSAHIVRMLDADATVDDLLQHMRWIVHERMGMSYFDEPHSRSCAEKLTEFWKTWRGS